MNWILKEEDFEEYLLSTEFIDIENPKVTIIAQYCIERAMHAAEINDKNAFPEMEAEVARQCFLLVRDEIKHSRDHGLEDVVFKASEVLEKKHALCFGKANLLCALLRACNIPAGIGYQFLRLDENDPESPLILHALNFVYLSSAGGWIRIDARGNREDLKSEMLLDAEQLPFTVDPGLGECDVPFIYAAHDLNVVTRMRMYNEISALWKDLPDKLAGKSILHKLK